MRSRRPTRSTTTTTTPGASSEAGAHRPSHPATEAAEKSRPRIPNDRNSNELLAKTKQKKKKRRSTAAATTSYPPWCVAFLAIAFGFQLMGFVYLLTNLPTDDTSLVPGDTGSRRGGESIGDVKPQTTSAEIGEAYRKLGTLRDELSRTPVGSEGVHLSGARDRLVDASRAFERAATKLFASRSSSGRGWIESWKRRKERDESTTLRSCWSYRLVNQTDDDMGRQLTIVTAWDEGCNPPTTVDGGNGNGRRKTTEQLVVYNPSPHERRWCGAIVEPYDVASYHDWTDACLKEPPHLFASDPASVAAAVESSSSAGADASSPSIELVLLSGRAPPKRGNRGRPGASLRTAMHDVRHVECDVPCSRRGGEPGESSHWTVTGTNWTIVHSMEGPGYSHHLRVDPDGYKSDKYYATTSFQSDVPLPYFSWSEYPDLFQSRPVDYDSVIKGASFIARNCDSKNGREGWVQGLQRYVRVDSLSKCLHNADPPDGLTLSDDKETLQSRYLFHLAFENQCEDDYVTEKLWGTLHSGTVPVYMGAPNVHEHAPPHSIIDVSDFASPEHLGRYLSKVASNRTLWESYHAWRRTGAPPADFARKYDFARTHSMCRMCRWAYAKKYGLRWDHEGQRIVPFDRKVCMDGTTGLALWPFREAWVSMREDGTQVQYAVPPNEESDGVDRCDKAGPRTRRILVGKHAISRTLSEHDGVVDIVVQEDAAEKRRSAGEGELYLRLDTGISNHSGNLHVYYNATVLRRGLDETDPLLLSQRHQDGVRCLIIQDETSRLMLLAGWGTTVHFSSTGSIYILVPGNRQENVLNERWSKYMRLILEPISSLHYDPFYVRPSFFANTMSEDIQKPLEMLFVQSLSPQPIA